MDPETKAHLRASDTKEKQAARARRYRERRKAEPRTLGGRNRGDPVTHPVTQTERPDTATPPRPESITGSVVCGLCGRLFATMDDGVAHVAGCRAGTPAKAGEPCCGDTGAEWHATPCLCSCHYPQTPAWAMTEKGSTTPPHRHLDDSTGRCRVCFAESERYDRSKSIFQADWSGDGTRIEGAA